MRGFSFASLLLVFFIIVLLFGTKRLRELGSDLGAAIKSFRKGMQEEETGREKKDEHFLQ